MTLRDICESATFAVFVAILLACLWYVSDQEWECFPQKIAGAWHVGDVCRVKR